MLTYPELKTKIEEKLSQKQDFSMSMTYNEFDWIESELKAEYIQCLVKFGSAMVIVKVNYMSALELKEFKQIIM